jgi:predicted  nucleic acid-binding Zn-ribbon protein
MKRTILGSLVVVTLIFGGCFSSSDDPKEVVIDFIKAIDSGDLESAYELGSDKVDKSLDKAKIKCMKKEVQEELKKVHKEIEQIQEKYDKKYQGVDENSDFSKKFELEIKKIGEKYNINRYRHRQPSEKKLLEIMNEVFDALEIKKEDKEILIARSLNKLDEYAKERVKKRTKNVEPECLKKYYDFKDIDTIDIVETKKGENIDEAVIRVEMIFKDKKSQKSNVSVERIQKEWKVTDMPF